MPLPTPTAAAATSDSLSQHAAHLSASLARRRADLALLRAEAATVALSLESAKHRLDLALRDETLIHATTVAAAAAAAPSSPRASYINHHAQTAAAASAAPDAPAAESASAAPVPIAAAADAAPAHDPPERSALARSLSTQLDVTQTALHDATRRRDALRDELARLQSAAATATAGAVAGGATGAEAGVTGSVRGAAALPVSTHTSRPQRSSPGTVTGTARPRLDNYTDLAVAAAPAAHADHNPLSAWRNPHHRDSAPAVASIAPASPPPTDPLLATLRDAVTSDTSFRADHARIWRDSTMPNLLLVSPDGAQPPRQAAQQQTAPDTPIQPRDDAPAPEPAASDDPGVALGVVTERIFEGVTCFTPTDAADTPPAAANHAPDLRIASHGPVASPDPSVAPRVARHYAVLSAPAGHGGGADPKLIAPRTALSRALNLIRDPDGSASGRRRKWRTPRLTSKKAAQPAAADAADTDAAKSGANDDESAVDASVNERRDAKDKAGTDEEKAAPTPVTPKLPVPKMSHKSTVLTGPQFAAIVADGVPIRFHDSALSLLYSTERDGMSLRTLYSRVRAASPTLVVIRDTRGRVFGCYGAQPWKSSATRYYGSGESFVFGTTTRWHDDDDDDGDDDDDDNNNNKNNDSDASGPDENDDDNAQRKDDATKQQESVRVYKWSRDNSFFQFTSASFLAIGGGAGSHFALWIDEDLLMGTTSACSTFGSPPLIDLANEDGSESLEFKILVVEVWGFGVRTLR